MNDWSYGCIAKLLAVAILDDMKLPAEVAGPSTIVQRWVRWHATSHLIQRVQHVLDQVVRVLEPA